MTKVYPTLHLRKYFLAIAGSGLAVFCTLFSTSIAAGSIITFDDLETSGTSFHSLSNPLELGEFSILATASGSPITFETSSSDYNGSAAIGVSNGADLVLSRIDSAAFNVYSVDIDNLFGGPGVVEFTGVFSGGGTVQQTFDADNSLGNETVLLAGFHNLASFQLGGVGVRNFANIGTADNVFVSSVPEPSSMVIFAPAIAFGLCRRNRPRILRQQRRVTTEYNGDKEEWDI